MQNGVLLMGLAALGMLLYTQGNVQTLGFAAAAVWDVGIEVVSKASDLCQQIAKLYPRATIFTGKLVFREERFYYGFLHSETARAIQRRLQWVGVPMVVLPIRARV